MKWHEGVAAARALHAQLFHNVSYAPQWGDDERWRYEEANRLAKGYCAVLLKLIAARRLDLLLSELRHSYRMGAEAKLALHADPWRPRRVLLPGSEVDRRASEAELQTVDMAVIQPRGKPNVARAAPEGPHRRRVRQTPEQTAVREVREETGLSGKSHGKLGDVKYSYRFDGRSIFKIVSFYLLELESERDLTT